MDSLFKPFSQLESAYTKKYVGFDDYISKPIDTRKVPNIIKKYLE